METVKQVLSDVASSLRIVGAPAATEPGLPLALALSPQIEPTALTNFAQSLVSLDLADGKLLGDLTGNLPVAGATGIVERAIDLDLAAELTGRLTGKLPIASLLHLRPKIDVHWTVKDENGNALIANRDFVAPDGLHTLFFKLIMIPTFVAAALEVPKALTRVISAEVTLSFAAPGSVTGNTTGSSAPPSAIAMAGLGAIVAPVEVKISVPPVFILVPQIPFPRMLVMATGLNFGGPVAIILPRSSFVTSVPTLLGLLKRISSVLSLLTSVARLAATLAGINALINMLEAPNIGVGVANGQNKFNELNEVDVDAGPWYSRFNDIEAEDEISSFVYIGPPRSSVEMFDNRNCKADDGHFKVTVGNALVALSRSLHGPVPDLFPRADAGLDFGATVTVLVAKSNFGNCLSSVRFS